MTLSMEKRTSSREGIAFFRRWDFEPFIWKSHAIQPSDYQNVVLPCLQMKLIFELLFKMPFTRSSQQPFTERWEAPEDDHLTMYPAF